MKKIPSVFQRDPDNLNRLLRDVHPDCQWVLDGEGAATRKFDGTCMMRDADGAWWARRQVKPGKTPPPRYVNEETDPLTGKSFGWIPAEDSDFWPLLLKAPTVNFVPFAGPPEGTYELCGPKLNGNPEGYDIHVLIRHDTAPAFDNVPRDYDGLADWLANHAEHEGIVFHHPDGRMAKLKARDIMDSE
jgi:hypothetical protein